MGGARCVQLRVPGPRRSVTGVGLSFPDRAGQAGAAGRSHPRPADRPRESVFRFLSEPDKQAQWADLAMRPLTEGPPAQGYRMEIVFGLGPIKARMGLEYRAFEPGRRLGFRT